MNMNNELREKIKNIIFLNIEAGYSKYLEKSYLYIKPSHEKYPFQWWWDTCFHICILCSLGEYELAKRNLLSLFAMQREDGFIGHMIYWQRLLPSSIFEVFETKPSLRDLRPHMSALIQPSFVAQSLERIYKSTGDIKFVNNTLPGLKKYHDWVLSNRVFDNDNLIVMIAPVESGMDSKPSYDEVLGFSDGHANWKLYFKWLFLEFLNFTDRYQLEKIRKANRFHVKDVAFNTINALDLLALGRLCYQTGDKQGGEKYTHYAKQITESIMNFMYEENDSAFYDLNGKDNKKLRTITPTILFPMALSEIPNEVCSDMIRKYLHSSEIFDLTYPIPSVSISDRSFVPNKQGFLGQDFLWRGPTWIFNNWFVFKCLVKRGFLEDAERLKNSTENLISSSELREYYNPFTGEGYGAVDFTWAGLLLDMNLD